MGPRSTGDSSARLRGVRTGASAPGGDQRLARSVVDWFKENGREFPWRKTRNPVHILLAEVLLRQTQAPRVVAPYLDLIAKYPDIESLAGANVASLRRRFRTLGLVKRADRLVECARILVQEHGGHVPQGLRELEALPGLGRYSARAVLCLAYGQAVPMIDEGSGRVLRRVLGQSVSGPSYASRPLMQAAEEIIPQSSAAEFNLGLIDIAASFCRPRTPLCSECPLVSDCEYARASTMAIGRCFDKCLLTTSSTHSRTTIAKPSSGSLKTRALRSLGLIRSLAGPS